MREREREGEGGEKGGGEMGGGEGGESDNIRNEWNDSRRRKVSDQGRGARSAV